MYTAVKSLAHLNLCTAASFTFKAAILLIGMLLFSNTQAQDTPIGKLPFFQSESLKYVGAFRLPVRTYGASRLGYANGSFAINSKRNSFTVVGHDHHQAFAEFKIPEIVNSTVLTDLNMTGDPLQKFVTIFDRIASGNPEGIDKITGMEFVNEQLIVHATQYYDGDGNNTDTTFIIREPSLLATSKVDGFFKLESRSHGSGWMSEIPKGWQDAFGGSYITGYASNYAINSRNSIGPTAFIFDPVNLINSVTTSSPTIETTTLLDFPPGDELNSDGFNNSLTNDLWTEVSKVNYGFIIPGTKTYATFGSSGGHVSGIKYKIMQENGHLCGGPCAVDYRDYYNYLWLWDVNDLLKVKNGDLPPHEVKPYWYGKLDLPFQNTSVNFNLMVGGDYDKNSGLLYILLRSGDSLQSIYESAPIMLVYEMISPTSPPQKSKLERP